VRLEHIRLKPFGGARDRTYRLGPGLNVLEGPNEFGKSTLCAALWHALFTPTDLTPSRANKIIGGWLPLPDGDHAGVALEFHADGRRWRLEKTWGAGAASLLEPEGGPPQRDAAGVQASLAKLLRLNEATWRTVLFTRQAELARTADRLAEWAGDLDDLHATLRGAAAIPGDIPPDRLSDAVAARVETAFGRWDRDADAPDAGRGLNNPWRREVGTILEAWYAVEKARAAMTALEEHERQVDLTNAEIARLETQLAEIRPIVDQGRELGPQIGRIEKLDAERARLEDLVERMSKTSDDWLRAEDDLPRASAALEASEKDLDQLRSELENAKRQAGAAGVRARYEKIVAAEAAWREAAEALAASPEIDAGALDELRELDREAAGLRAGLAGRKLTAELSSDEPSSAEVRRGAGPVEAISLDSGDAWRGEADGSITVKVGGLRLSVISGRQDEPDPVERLQAVERALGEGLASLGFTDLEAARSAREEASGLGQRTEWLRESLDSQLGGQTIEDLAAEVGALEELPGARDVAVLEKLEREKLLEQGKQRERAEQLTRSLEAWALEHGDRRSLRSALVERETQLREVARRRSELPDVPEGFATAQEYLAELERARQRQAELVEQRSKVIEKRAHLEGSAPPGSLEDLREEFDARRRDLDRRKAEGESLLRIQALLAELTTGDGGDDPLADLAEDISARFGSLTDERYTRVLMNGAVPRAIEADGTRAEVATRRLSQGTAGALALAVVLSLADAYLADDDGFLVLDDPFVDMDPRRRRAAVDAVANFAARRQVLFVTCHPEHAAELLAGRGARAVAHETEEQTSGLMEEVGPAL